MEELTQEEIATLREKASKYDELLPQHEKLVEDNNALKDDYIKLCKGQQQSNEEVDDFDVLCSKKFGK